MGNVGNARQQPRAIIHKQILDIAESRPEASMTEIADDVSGASVDLVERVLEEYGDPSEQGTEPDPSEEPSMTEQSDAVSQNGTKEAVESVDLSEEQLRAFRFVRENPDASQAEIGDRLGVSRATVSRRLNAVPGFEWEKREAIARQVLSGVSEDAGTTATDGSVAATVTERVDGHDDEPDNGDRVTAPATMDQEFAHRVIHACMKSDRISEDEELDLMRTLL